MRGDREEHATSSDRSESEVDCIYAFPDRESLHVPEVLVWPEGNGELSRHLEVEANNFPRILA